MTEREIIDWLIFGIVVAWICKIGFHFVYLKSVDKSIKELNFISFYLKIENFFTSFLLILPLFFARTSPASQEIIRARLNARLSTYLLWAMFVVTGFYLYNHPPKKEVSTIEYDMTNGETQ